MAITGSNVVQFVLKALQMLNRALKAKLCQGTMGLNQKVPRKIQMSHFCVGNCNCVLLTQGDCYKLSP